DRILADVEVTPKVLAGMGVGGLLMEIPTRPQLREAADRPKAVTVGAMLLAAGRSSRMGTGNKLLSEFDGEALVRRSAKRVLASRSAFSVAVRGHPAEEVGEALEGLAIERVINPDYADGLSSSLKAGIRAMPETVAGALIVLAD